MTTVVEVPAGVDTQNYSSTDGERFVSTIGYIIIPIFLTFVIGSLGLGLST